MTKTATAKGYAPQESDAILRLMRRSTLWFAIAAFWFADALFALYRHRVGQAELTAACAIAFGVVGIVYREKGRR